MFMEMVTNGDKGQPHLTRGTESEEKVIINVDSGRDIIISVNASKPIHAEQTEVPRSIHYSTLATNLASSINMKLSVLASDPLNFGSVCIYKVPEKHRKKNEEAYTPRLVSIGPLHQGGSQLQGMEEQKLKYLNNFLHTFRVPLEHLAEYVRSQEKLVCQCYEDAFTRHISELSEVVLLDGIFIIELFLKNHFPEMREMGDTVFENPWVSNDILHDLLLLENQLPMRFVSTMYNGFVSRKLRKFLDNDSADPPCFDELAQEYFKDVGNTAKLKLPRDSPSGRHLVEFLAVLHGPKHPRVEPKPGKNLEYARCATASNLLAAGVKFSRVEEACLFEVHFEKEKGELKIPQLTINDSTETFFRNLIAFEQCGYHARDITSYVILMDNLIDTPKDVDILVKHEIITNFLGTSEQVADVFNNLYKEIVTDPKKFYFASLCSELNEYRRTWWHKLKSKFSQWIAIFWRDHFNSPWSIISFSAAFLLLGLTVIQAVCALLPFVIKKKSK